MSDRFDRLAHEYLPYVHDHRLLASTIRREFKAGIWFGFVLGYLVGAVVVVAAVILAEL